jgi:hypothetical protein
VLLSLRDQIFGRIHENDGGATPVGWRKPKSADILIEGRKRKNWVSFGSVWVFRSQMDTSGYTIIPGSY